MGGLTPSRASPRLYFPPKEGSPRSPVRESIPLGAMGAIPKGATQRGNPRVILPQKASQGVIRSPSGWFPGVILPRWPPHIRGSLWGVFLVARHRFLPIFRTFLGDILVMVEFYSHRLLVYIYVFFSEIVLWRNYLINRVALVEESPILLLLRCLGASE